MAYLTYEQYTGLGGKLNEVEFNASIFDAELQLDSATNFIYAGGMLDLVSDTSSEMPWEQARANAFKRALVATVNHIAKTGEHDSGDVANSGFSQIQIGRMNIQPTGNSSSANGSVYSVPREATALLAPFGLLYSGVPSV